MGVIRWEEKYPGRWYGYLGKHGIADVINFGSAVVWTLPDTLRNTDTEEFPGGTTAVSIEAAKTAVEEFVLTWMSNAGLVSKAEFDEVRRSAKVFISELTTATIAANCGRDFAQKQTREVERLERVLKNIRREIGRESNRDIYCRVMKIVDDSHFWAKDPVAKQRTEADFGDADIDANGYVTFRNGGVA